MLKEQVDLRPYKKEFMREQDLPSDWKSFNYQSTVNSGGVPSEIVEEQFRER